MLLMLSLLLDEDRDPRRGRRIRDAVCQPLTLLLLSVEPEVDRDREATRPSPCGTTWRLRVAVWRTPTAPLLLPPDPDGTKEAGGAEVFGEPFPR